MLTATGGFKRSNTRFQLCAPATQDCLNPFFFLVPGIILRDRNVLGQEQEERGSEDLFLDLRQEQVKEDVGDGGFDSAM